MRRNLGAVKVGGIDVQMLEDIMEQVQSDELRGIMDLMWTTVISITDILDATTRGRGGDGPPKFLKKFLYAVTWFSHSWNRTPINCAAFSLAYLLNNCGGYPTKVNFSEKGKIARERASLLQTRLGWGDSVGIADVEHFCRVFPKYKLTIFYPVQRSPAASHFKVFTGLDFSDEKYSATLVLFDEHWALCSSIQGFVDGMKHGGLFTYCKDCLKILPNPTRLPLSELPCHLQGPPKKKQKILKACTAPQCKGEHHPEGGKPCVFKSCPSCKVDNDNRHHRCCMMPKTFGEMPPQEKYWSDAKGDYDFCTDKTGDGKTPAFWAYDIETMIHKIVIKPLDPSNLVKPDLDENFGYDIEEFNERY